MVRRFEVAPSLNKSVGELSQEEMVAWRALGWLTPLPEDTRQATENPIWSRPWAMLLPAEQDAATSIGWDVKSWSANVWLLPRKTRWSALTPNMQQRLLALGETPEGWDKWSVATASATSFANTNDMREWHQLSPKEQDAASTIGLSQPTWDLKEMADIPATVDNVFGPDFTACVTQGCDIDSLDLALQLATAHPKIYASFGCHPKGAWSYNDKLEERLLAAIKTCGTKAVAWGEFGLDYSHATYGGMGGNRRLQKEIFVRQLRLAVREGLPMVLHLRGAERDSLRIMRQWVPRDWKVHIHSYRGTSTFMELALAEWKYSVVGFSGLVTMGDVEVEQLCSLCPLERVILETDAPYLPLNKTFYSHPGQIPVIANRVAELKGCSVQAVLAAHRRSTRAIYGI